MSSGKPRKEPGVLAWHWLRDDRRLGYNDGRLVKVGETLEMLPVRMGDVVLTAPELCRAGMHASISPLDALRHAPGPVACRVVVEGDVEYGSDKIVGRRRTVLAMGNAEGVLRAFARQCALDVIHLWDAPDIVRRYLETGDEALRAAARAAAWAAASAAASAAAWAAAWAAARSAAWDAASAAAWAAARSAARSAARDAQSKLLHEMLCKELGCE